MLAYLYFQNPDHDYHGEGGLTPFGSDPTDFSPLVPGEQVRDVSFWLGADYPISPIPLKGAVRYYGSINEIACYPNTMIQSARKHSSSLAPYYEEVK